MDLLDCKLFKAGTNCFMCCASAYKAISSEGEAEVLLG